MQHKIFIFTFVIMAFGFSSQSHGRDNQQQWQRFLQEDQFTVYKGREDKSRSLPFKAEGNLRAPLRSLVMAIFDYSNKKRWAPRLVRVDLLKRVSDKEFIFTEEYRAPWPAYHRLFHLHGAVSSPKEGIFIFAAKNAQPTKSEPCCITSNVKKIEIKLEKIKTNLTKVTFTFHGHFGGWIPSWLSNLILRKWPLKFLKGLETYGTGITFTSPEYLRIEKLHPWLRHSANES